MHCRCSAWSFGTRTPEGPTERGMGCRQTSSPSRAQALPPPPQIRQRRTQRSPGSQRPTIQADPGLECPRTGRTGSPSQTIAWVPAHRFQTLPLTIAAAAAIVVVVVVVAVAGLVMSPHRTWRSQTGSLLPQTAHSSHSRMQRRRRKIHRCFQRRSRPGPWAQALPPVPTKIGRQTKRGWTLGLQGPPHRTRRQKMEPAPS